MANSIVSGNAGVRAFPAALLAARRARPPPGHRYPVTGSPRRVRPRDKRRRADTHSIRQAAKPSSARFRLSVAAAILARRRSPADCGSGLASDRSRSFGVAASTSQIRTKVGYLWQPLVIVIGVADALDRLA